MESAASGSPLTHFRIKGDRLHDLIGLQPPRSVLVFGNGPFQRRVLFGTFICLLATALHHMALSVLARLVDHWCQRPPGYENLPLEEWKNVSLPRRRDGRPNQCARYEPPLAEGSDNRTEVPCEAWEYDLSQGGPTITSQWDLVCSRRRLLLVLMAINLVGGAVAATLAGLGADVFGRRPVVCAAVLVFVCSGLATCLARSLCTFATLRFTTAAAAAAAELGATLILFEVTPRDSRTGFTTLALSAAFTLSSAWMAMTARFTYNWVTVQASIMLPALFLAPATYWMEESPRWLTVTWKFIEAEQVVLWAAHVNRLNIRDLRPLFREVANNVKLRQSNVRVMSSAWDLLRSRRMRTRTIIVYGCWFFVFNAIGSLRPRTRVRDIVPASAVVMYVVGPLLAADYRLMKGWGRRRTLSLWMALLSVLCIAMAVLPAGSIESALLWTGIALLLISAVVVLFVYTIEVFPTVVRGAGLAGAMLSGRLGALAAMAVRNLVRSDVLQMDVLQLVVVALGALCFCQLALRLPETSVQRVTDTIQEAEEEELVHVESLLTIFIRSRCSPHCSEKAPDERP